MKKSIFISFLFTVLCNIVSFAQSSQLRGFKSFDLGLGLVSSYAGPCVTGGAFCSGGVRELNADFLTAIKANESSITLALSREFFQKNQADLKGGLRISQNFSLPSAVSEALGIRGEYTLRGNTVYPITQIDGIYFIELDRLR